MKTLIFILFSIPFFACALPSSKEVTEIYYDPVTEFSDGTPVTTEIVGYMVYWRSPSGSYTDADKIDVGGIVVNQLSSFSLSDGVYYLAVTAYEDIGGQKIESNFSNEIKLTVNQGSYSLIGLGAPGNVKVR